MVDPIDRAVAAAYEANSWSSVTPTHLCTRYSFENNEEVYFRLTDGIEGQHSLLAQARSLQAGHWMAF
jgi:hypothetical protein